MNNMQTTIQTIADQMNFITQHLTATTRITEATMQPTSHSPVKKKQCHVELGLEGTTTANSNAYPPTVMTANITTLNEAPTTDMSNKPNVTNANQEEAQYNSLRSPGTAMEE